MTRWAGSPQIREQMVLFSDRLDDVIPPDHGVRRLDEILELLDWSKWEAKYEVRRGQPAIHPRVLVGVLLYGLLVRIRSSRGLEEALQVRMDFRWLVAGRAIDHTTISEFRRKNSAELKDLFVQVCQVGASLGIVSFERLGFDGTRVRSNNRRSGTRTPEELRKEQEELAAKFEQLAKQAEEEDRHDEELFGGEADALPPELRDTQRRLEKLREMLKKLEDLKEEGGTVPKRVPTIDPDSRVMPNKDGGHAPNYTPLATVDIASGMIVSADVLAVHNEDKELIPALEEVSRDFGVPVAAEVLTDGLNGTGANLAGCAERGIEIFSPCKAPDPGNPALRADLAQAVPEADWDRLPTSKVKGGSQLDKSAFVYDQDRNRYMCPLGNPLEYANTTTEKCGSGYRIRDRYQANPQDCAACPLRERCIQRNAKARQINREQYETHRERHAQKMATTEAQAVYALRRHPGERPFAVIKQQFGIRQFLLRGLEGVRAEWRWAATAFNLKIMMSRMHGSRAGPA